MPYRRFVSQHPDLADKAQDVVCQGGHGHHQTISGELAGGQSLQVEIGFELAVELLTGAMILVELDNLRFGKYQIRPPTLDLDL